jgi:hypothetical protein
MRNYKLTAGDKEIKTLKTPQGRHEVSYYQWAKAYEYILLSQEAKQDFEDGKFEEATKKSIESITRVIAALGTGATYKDLLRIEWDKINNIFLLDFEWLSNEEPKREFKIKGRKFTIPNFDNSTAGDYMDVMDILRAAKDNSNDIDMGLTIASVYLKDDKEYKQDVDAINERKEFLKKYAKIDLFYSVAFFLTNSLVNLKIDIQQHSQIVMELAKLTSSLNGWASILYLQACQKAKC